jgi:uncharacterized membrane protein YccC
MPDDQRPLESSTGSTTVASEAQGSIRTRGTLGRLGSDVTNVLRTAGPPLLFGLRVWASVLLALYVAFWLELDDPFWAATSAAIVCQPRLGASLRKGWYRMVGTLVGAAMIVVLTALFPQDRVAFLAGLALWVAAAAFGATLLRNFAAYAAALAGYTAAIIASDTLGATGGPNGDVFLPAVSRASEICIGIVCAGIVLAGTDLGAAPRRLAWLFAKLTAEITHGVAGALALAGPEMETQPVRRELVRQVMALDPVIDETIGESSQLRHRSPVLQSAVDGLLAALAGWRAVALRLERLPSDEARREAAAVRRSVPAELRSTSAQDDPTRWLEDPVRLRRISEAAMQRLLALPTGTPSLRLLADRTAEIMAGISDALDGLALLAVGPGRPILSRRASSLRIPDWLPSLVNAGRAFIAIGAVELFWIVTQWPSGALAITFAAIGVTLLTLQAEQAHAASMALTVGAILSNAFAAIIAFAVLPGLETFAGLSLAMGLVLAPAGALMAQARCPSAAVVFTVVTMTFCAFLAPTNQEIYDPLQFYNNASAIIAGFGVATLSFRLIPPLSPAFRTRRLLALTLRDLRRLATGGILWTLEDWESRIYARILVLPDQAESSQRSEILAALSVGCEIIRLRRIDARHALGPDLDAAFMAVAQGQGVVALARLTLLDHRLSSAPAVGKWSPVALPARAHILEISELLTQHAAYFGAGAPT